MKLALYHGYELSGSGSNEYTRYLARTLAELGHRVTLICREPHPEQFDFVDRALSYDTQGVPTPLFDRGHDGGNELSLHRLPSTSVYPVYLKDKQRDGCVKTFPELTPAELTEYDEAMTRCVTRVLRDERPDLLHANHLVYQPTVAAKACAATSTPFYIVPHGSSIEYTIHADTRFREAAGRALAAADGVVWVAREVRQRVLDLYPELADSIAAKSTMVGVGTDTSLFRPISPDERGAALQRLLESPESGGRTRDAKQALLRKVAAGEIATASANESSYDQSRPDADLAQTVDEIDPSDELLLFVGALTYGKGVQGLIAALPQIVEARPHVRLVIVGSGHFRETLEALSYALELGRIDLVREIASGEQPLEDLRHHLDDPEHAARLAALGPRIAGRVHFLGRLDHSRLRHIFPCCRMAIFPSVIKEASPLVFCEALANGVLPSGSYHSGLRDGLDDLREHIDDSLWRELCLETDPTQRVHRIAEQVTRALALSDDPHLPARLRRIAVDRYDWKAVAQRLVEAACLPLVGQDRGSIDGACE